MQRTLVIVTCYRDLYPLHILFKSINKYLEPSKIIIVVNEKDDIKWLTWYDRTKNLLLGHDVKVVYREDLIKNELIAQTVHPEPSGWTLQNILKLVVSSIVETDEYVLLDSKNFFIKTTNLQNIKRRRKVHVFHDIDWDIGWIMAVVSKLSNASLDKLLDGDKLLLTTAHTPYIMNTSHVHQLIEYFGGFHVFVKWFLNTAENLLVCGSFSPAGVGVNVFISEFYLYDLFCSLELGVEYSDRVAHNSWVLWSKRHQPKEPITRIPESIYVGGIHREYIKESSKTEIDNIYRYFGLDEV
jgi:hypothetical protein